MRISSRDAAGIVLPRSAMYQLKTGLEGMRALDPTQGVCELHQWTRIEAGRGSRAIERRIVAQRCAADRTGLRVEQLSFELWERGQCVFRRSGDIGFRSTAHAATDVEWR